MKELVSTQYPKGKSPALVYLSGLLPTGRRTMKGKLQKVATMYGLPLESLPWGELRYEHVQAIRVKLIESGLAPATVNACLSALRGVSRAAFLLELMPADAYERIRCIKSMKGSRVPPGRALSVTEIRDLLNTCTGTIGIRDAALIGLLYAGGLRRAEIVALDLADYHEGEIKVIGKGDKQRLVYINGGTMVALDDWLFLRGDTPGALFHPVRKGGEILHRRMTEDAIYGLLINRANKAKIKRFSPHDLRRSFISFLLDQKTDIVTVSQLAGHASVETTARYDRRDEDAKKEAAKLFHLPYTKMERD